MGRGTQQATWGHKRVRLAQGLNNNKHLNNENIAQLKFSSQRVKVRYRMLKFYGSLNTSVLFRVQISHLTTFASSGTGLYISGLCGDFSVCHELCCTRQQGTWAGIITLFLLFCSENLLLNQSFHFYFYQPHSISIIFFYIFSAFC